MRAMLFLPEATHAATLRPFRDLSPKRRLTLITLLASVVPLLVASVGFIAYEQRATRRDSAAELGTTAEALATLSSAALARGDAAALAQGLEVFRGRPEILGAQIFDPAGRLVAAHPADGAGNSIVATAEGTSERFESKWLEVSRPIVAAGAPIGTIVVRMDGTKTQQRLRRYVAIAGTVLLLAILGAYLVASRLQRIVASPLASLAEITRRVTEKKDFAARVAKGGDSEVDRVIDGFNEMLDGLQAREEELQEARAELERQVAAQTREMSVEQARFKGIFEAAPVGFTWMTRGDVATRIVNPAHEQITGVPRAECQELGRYREATHPDDRGAQDALHARLEKGEIDHYTIEKRYLHSDGAVHWVALTVRFYRDSRTGDLQEINTLVDITERKRAEAGLAQASQLLDAMMENTPDMIYFKDRDSRFVRFSRAFLGRFQLSDEKTLIGKTDFDLFTPEHAQKAFADEQEIIRTGRAIVGQVERETYTDGRVSWAMTTKMPWRDSHGEIIGTFGISKDVTAMKEAEAKAAYERDLLQLLLDNLPETIYFKDRESRFVRFSRSKAEETWRSLRAQLGPADEVPPHLVDYEHLARWLIGKRDADVFLAERAQQAFAEEQEIMRTGEPVLHRLEQVKGLDGTEVWHLITKMPWRDKDGKIIGTFGTTHDISAIKEAEAKLEETHKQLLETSRQAGMAEVATGVLHNVGNVLNSVNVSATLVADHVRHTKASNIAKLAALFAQNRDRLGDFITKDSRGQMVPEYLGTLAEAIAGEQKSVCLELDNLRKNIEHIKDIVAMQQSYARTSGVIETISVPDMIEDALRMNSGSLVRHDVKTVRDYQARGVITTDKHKVIQILINLVRNAKYACDESGRTDKEIVVRTTSDAQGVKIAIIDNGVGIAPENLTRIFAHGFTTRQHGHGFGLHSGALAAKELGGALIVHSDGPGRGAVFTLELPYKPEPKGK